MLCNSARVAFAVRIISRSQSALSQQQQVGVFAFPLMPTPETGPALKTQFTKIHTKHTFTRACTKWPMSQKKTHNTHSQDDLGVRTTYTLTQDDLGVRKTHTLTQDDLGVRKTHTLTQDDLGVRKTHTLTHAHTRWPVSQKNTHTHTCTHKMT